MDNDMASRHAGGVLHFIRYYSCIRSCELCDHVVTEQLHMRFTGKLALESFVRWTCGVRIVHPVNNFQSLLCGSWLNPRTKTVRAIMLSPSVGMSSTLGPSVARNLFSSRYFRSESAKGGLLRRRQAARCPGPFRIA